MQEVLSRIALDDAKAQNSVTFTLGIIGGAMLLTAVFCRALGWSAKDTMQGKTMLKASRINFYVFGGIAAVHLAAAALSLAAGRAAANLPFNYEKDVISPMERFQRLETEHRWQRRYLLAHISGLPKFRKDPEAFAAQWSAAAGKTPSTLESAVLTQVQSDLAEGRKPGQMHTEYSRGLDLDSGYRAGYSVRLMA